MNAPALRPAGAEDAEALAELHAEAFDDPWTAAAIAELIGADGALAFWAQDGFVLARALAGEAEILTLAVRPAARGRGLGARLVQAAMTEAARRGADALFLEVAADNAAALALYRRAGFEPVGRRAGYYRRPGAAPMDALVLRRTLTPGTA